MSGRSDRMMRAALIAAGFSAAACAGPVAADLPATATTSLRDDAKACDRGDPYACTNVAAAWADGSLGVPDPARALALLEPACDAGAHLACVNAADLVDIDEATRLLTAACAEFMPACLALGRLVRDADPSASQRALDTACEGGLFAACVEHALVGLASDAPGDRASALHRLRTTCSSGAPEACREFGRTLTDDPTEDPAIALQMLQRGCAGGDAESCSLVADALRRSDDPTGTSADAFQRQACDLGWTPACE